MLKRISEMQHRLPSAEGQDPGLAALRVIEGRTRALAFSLFMFESSCLLLQLLAERYCLFN